MPLTHKLEVIILRMFDCLCDGTFKASYPSLKNSSFWKDPNESIFEMVDG